MIGTDLKRAIIILRILHPDSLLMQLQNFM